MFESMPQVEPATFFGKKRAPEDSGSEKVESEEADFDIGFAETLPAGVMDTSPLGGAEMELVGKTTADDSGELHIYCLDAINEMTPAVFNNAIQKKDVFGAYLQAERAFQYNIESRQSMKTRLIALIDELLAQPDEEIAFEERSKLEKLKSNVLEESFSSVSANTELSSESAINEFNEADRHALNLAAEEGQK